MRRKRRLTLFPPAPSRRFAPRLERSGLICGKHRVSCATSCGSSGAPGAKWGTQKARVRWKENIRKETELHNTYRFGWQR